MSVFRGTPLLPPLRARWISGKDYPLFRGTVGASGAVLATNTLYGYIAALPIPVAVSALFGGVQTGGAGSSMKAGIWRVSPVTGRPFGTPIASNNTGVATTGTGAASLAVTATLPAGLLFCGSVFTGTLPVMFNVAGSQTESVLEIGADTQATAIAQTVTGGLSTPFTYTGDIGALNLTGATWTDVTGNPTRVPILGFTVA